MKKLFLIIVIIFFVFLVGLLSTIRIRHGGGRDFEDRSATPILPPSALEVVASLEEPPGNIAVSATGRIFITIHPLSRPQINEVVELMAASRYRIPMPRSKKICSRLFWAWP